MLGGGTMEFAEAFIITSSLKHDIENAFKVIITLRVLIYVKSLFDVLTKATSSTEKNLCSFFKLFQMRIMLSN